MSATATVQRVDLAKGRRYPVRVIEFARRLHEENGYGVPEVIEALARQGFHPSRSTVFMWVYPERREAHNLKQKRRLYPARKKDGIGPEDQVWWAKYRRMVQLREATLSFRSIAVLMKLDYDVDLSDEQVRYILNVGGKDAAKRALA